MSHRVIEEYLKDIRKRLHRLSLPDQDAALEEIRAHLEEEARAMRRRERGLSKEEAALRATTAFGAPDDIAVAYTPDGAEVRRSTGETLLRLATLTGRAAGRSARGILKWTGITLLVLLATALIVLVASLWFLGGLVDTFQDDIREAVPRPIYTYAGSWTLPGAHTDVATESFEVREDLKEFRFRTDTQVETGCAAIQLVSPGGQVIDLNGNGCASASSTRTFQEPGIWQVRYLFVAYTGSVSVDAYGFENVRSDRGAVAEHSTPSPEGSTPGSAASRLLAVAEGPRRDGTPKP